MKNKILLFIIIVFFTNQLIGQECNEEINTTPGSTIGVWDWTQEIFDDVWVSDEFNFPVNISLNSPFFTSATNSNVFHLNDGTERDYLPEDGWEVVLKHFGNAQEGVPIPTFLLYNRYEGNLRCFLYVRNDIAPFNQAKVAISFNNETTVSQSGLLSFIQQPVKALDSFEKGLNVVTPNGYNTNQGGGYWLFADFPTAYDPCSCDHFSTLDVMGTLINVETIELKMEGGGTIEQIVSGSSQNSNTSSITSLPKIIDGAVSNGIKTSKSFKKFEEGYKLFAQPFDMIFQKKNEQGETEVSKFNDLSESEKKKVNNTIKKGVSVPGWIKSLPNIGFAFGLFETLIGGGKKSQPKPMNFNVKLSFDIDGTSTNEIPFGGATVYTPGSDWDSEGNGGNPARMPIYNNTLGVFSVLKTPEVHRATSIIEEEDPFGLERFLIVEGDAFQLAEPIEYAINPASGLSLVDIKAALVFEGCENEQNYPFFNMPTSSSVLRFVNEGDVGRWQTPFVPASCFGDLVINTGNITSYNLDPSDHCDPTVMVKVLVTLARSEDDPFFDPSADQVMLMLEYAANLTEVEELTSENDFDQIRLNETITDLELTEDLTIYAWSTIEVIGEIVTNGYKLTLIAGHEISSEGMNIPPEAELIIGYPNPCQTTLPGLGAVEVDDFCKSGNYNPLLENAAVYRQTQNEKQSNFDFQLKASPNPFDQSISLTYSNAVEGNAEIIVVDGLGRTVYQSEIELQSGFDQALRIDSENWIDGLYILTLRTESAFETIKLLKKSL